MKIQIEVAFVGEKSQLIIPIEMNNASTLEEALEQSGILQKFPELGCDIKALKDRVGIFGEIKTFNTVLKEGDRVEIYRSLKIDPKEARRARARKERALQRKMKYELKNSLKDQNKGKNQKKTEQDE